MFLCLMPSVINVFCSNTGVKVNIDAYISSAIQQCFVANIRLSLRHKLEINSLSDL